MIIINSKKNNFTDIFLTFLKVVYDGKADSMLVMAAFGSSIANTRLLQQITILFAIGQQVYRVVRGI